MFKVLVRTTVPVVAFGLGVVTFPIEWRKTSFVDRKLTHINESAIENITSSDIYKQLIANPRFKQYNSSKSFPDQHHQNYVGTGILFGPDLNEIDPIVFIDETKGELTGFYHLGDKLISQDGQIHNGIVSTILDEGLCSAGFPLVPSKKGVTAKLSIDFKSQAPPNSTVVLRANVIEARGRKVVIEGTLLTFPADGNETVIATSQAILVEPKWFKYLSWIHIV